MKKHLLTLALLASGSLFIAKAQIQTDTTAPYDDPEYLVSDVLLGGGVTAANITYTGGATQIGYFEDDSPDVDPGLGLNYGVVMNTGGVSNVEIGGGFTGAGGVSGEADLLAVAQSVPALIGASFTVSSINDIAVLEFDFVPTSNLVEFRYVFGSDEWNTWINSSFNDAFGFFVSGPGIVGPYTSPAGFPDGSVNIAVIPDTDPEIPITISSITPTLNSAYYVANGSTGGAQVDHSLNAQTVVMTAIMNVVCGDTYHIKMAVGDGSDGALDSAVFLEGGSFSSSGINALVESDNPEEDDRLTENCYSGPLTLNLNSPNETEPTVVDLIIGGTAINGVDYTEIPTQLIYAPGVISETIIIEPLEDDLVEGDEIIEIGFQVCDEILTLQYIIEDRKEILLSLSEDLEVCDDELDTQTFIAFAEGGYEPYTYTWTYNGAVVGNGFTLTVFPQDTGIYTCEVVGDCGESKIETVELSSIPSSPVAYFESDFNADASEVEEGCEYVRLNFELPEVSTEDTVLDFIVSGDAVPGVDYYDIPSSITIPAGDLTASINVEAIVDGIYEVDEYINFVFPFYDQCKPDNTLQLTVKSVSRLSVDLPNDFIICEGDEINVPADIQGGIAPYVTTWTAPNGEVWSGENLVDIPLDDLLYSLTITDACGVQVKDEIHVTVPHFDPIKIVDPVSGYYNVCLNDELIIDAEVIGGSGIYDYIWYLEGIEYAHGTRLEIPTAGESSFNYELVAADSCLNTVTHPITIDVVDCQIPNVFTPNSDGENDYFFLNVGDVENNVRLEIFNRWGQQVYGSMNYERCTDSQDRDCWDGTNYNTGKVCAEGTYYYVLEFFDGRIKKGNFTLFK